MTLLDRLLSTISFNIILECVSSLNKPYIDQNELLTIPTAAIDNMKSFGTRMSSGNPALTIHQKDFNIFQ